MNADFRFHPVGHGLFYSGEIHLSEMKGNPFTFVYDCGGVKVADRFEEFWNPYRETGRRLDLLVVSHFHFDHINGVPNLIKTAKPRSLVLPYLYPAEKIAYVAALSAAPDIEATTSDLEEIGKLILDPESFCRLYCENKDCRIYYIYPDKKDGANENRGWENRGRGIEGLYIPSATLINGKYDVFKVPNGSAGCIAGWEFHFFMPKEASFSREFKDWMKGEGITNNLYKLGSGADELFKKIKDKFRGLSSSTNPNVSNVVCAHGPLDGGPCLGKWVVGADGSCFSCWRRWGCCTGVSADRRFAGVQVLTGDAEFSDTVPVEIKNLPIDRCFLFQIPHHGSKNGWRDWFNELPSCKLRPVTHRWNCTYNGNSFMTDRENLIDACHITESPMSALNVRMFV